MKIRKQAIKTLRNPLFICSLLLILLVGGTINLYGSSVGLGASCSLTSSKARAQVTWIHPTYIWDMIVPHSHRVDYSVSARVGDQDPDSTVSFSTFMSNSRFYSPAWAIASQTGNQRWDGDGYASGSISDSSSQDNWRFCADPQN